MDGVPISIFGGRCSSFLSVAMITGEVLRPSDDYTVIGKEADLTLLPATRLFSQTIALMDFFIMQSSSYFSTV